MGARCIFCKHNKEANTSVTTGLLGTNQWDSDRVCCWHHQRRWLDCRAGCVHQWRGETRGRQDHVPAMLGRVEDSRNKKPCLKWLAMLQSQHFEDRLKAPWVENTISNKSTIPFCPHGHITSRLYWKSMNIQFTPGEIALPSTMLESLIIKPPCKLVNTNQILLPLILCLITYDKNVKIICIMCYNNLTVHTMQYLFSIKVIWC